MNRQTQFDTQITAYLAEGPTEFPMEWREQIAAAAELTAQRRAPAGWPTVLGNPWLRFAAAVLAIGLLAVVVSQLVEQPEVGPPTVAPWTPDAMRHPFPAPLREEPPGGAGVVDARQTTTTNEGSGNKFAWVDPTGDGQPATDPRVDLVFVEFSQAAPSCQLRQDQLCVYYAPAQLIAQPIPEPTADWISYGLVFDRDGDGQADGRFGLDNIPDGFFRAWHDMLNGDTAFYLSSTGTADGGYGESQFPIPGAGTRRNQGYMWITPSLVGTIDNPHGQFYMWAALIRGDQIVSLDYLPDAGWLNVPDEN